MLAHRRGLAVHDYFVWITKSIFLICFADIHMQNLKVIFPTKQKNSISNVCENEVYVLFINMAQFPALLPRVPPGLPKYPSIYEDSPAPCVGAILDPPCGTPTCPLAWMVRPGRSAAIDPHSSDQKLYRLAVATHILDLQCRFSSALQPLPKDQIETSRS